MSDFINEPRGTYNPIILKTVKMMHIHTKHVHVEFHWGNKIFKKIIFAKHIFLRGPILDLVVNLVMWSIFIKYNTIRGD